MSIDQQSRSATNPRETEAQRQAGSNESAKKRAIDLSPSQVLGGALAAMTAAAIGSRLGAAGTIIGAAAASVVAAVAGAVYTASLRHTHAKVRTVWIGRSSSGIPATVEAISDRADATAAKAGPQHIAPRLRGPLFQGRLRIPWKPAALGALLAFGIAAATLTGLELISGHALSGGEGTTVTQVSQRDAGSDPAKPDPETKAKDKTPASSSEPTQSPEPSTSPSSSPEDTSPTPEPEPTATPVPTAGPSSSSAPSPRGTPSG
jgi:hypothetical protein